MSTQASVTDLRITTTNRQILSIALPISFSIFVPQINFITNNIFLGQLGEEALAAAGITGVYYLIFAVIGFGLNNGLQALISRRAGQDRVHEIGKLFIQGVYISLALAALGILFTYLATPTIFRLTLQSTSTAEKCLQFLKIRIWGLPFLYIYQMRNALLVGTNQSKLLVWGTIAETITNIFLDYCLIYGHFGFPALGFNGAAIASIIAEFMGMFIVFSVIEWKGLGRKLALYKNLKPDAQLSKLLLNLSSPLIFQYTISIVSWEYFYILIEHYGSRDLAISNTMRNIFGIFGVFTWAFAATCNTMVSNIIGQELHHQVPTLIKRISRLSFLITVFLCVLLNLFPGTILSLFGQGQEFVEQAVPVVRVLSLALIIMSVSTVWLNAVTGTGNSRINLGIEVVAILVYSIYVYLILHIYRLPIVYGWMSEWLYWSTILLLSWYYIRNGRWREKVI